MIMNYAMPHTYIFALNPITCDTHRRTNTANIHIDVILLVLLSAVIALMHCVMPILGQCVGAVLVVVIDRSPLMDAVQFSSGLGNAVVWSN